MLEDIKSVCRQYSDGAITKAEMQEKVAVYLVQREMTDAEAEEFVAFLTQP